MAKINHDPEVHPETSFDALPAGTYTLHVESSEMKPTKNNDGAYLQLTMEVLDEGQFKGRKLWDRLNLHNKSDTAVKIARGQLTSLCKACGKVNVVEDSEELHRIPFLAKVGVIKGQTGDDMNVIKKYIYEDEMDEDETPRDGVPSWMK